MTIIKPENKHRKDKKSYDRASYKIFRSLKYKPVLPQKLAPTNKKTSVFQIETETKNYWLQLEE